MPSCAVLPQHKCRKYSYKKVLLYRKCIVCIEFNLRFIVRNIALIQHWFTYGKLVWQPKFTVIPKAVVFKNFTLRFLRSMQHRYIRINRTNGNCILTVIYLSYSIQKLIHNFYIGSSYLITCIKYILFSLMHLFYLFISTDEQKI